MSKVIHLNTLKPYLAKLKVNGGMWQIGSGKFAIKHLEVEKLASLYGIETDINLIHCNLEIFKHSLKENYSNILVLEDDFIIEDSATDIKHINEINKFCLQHKHKKCILSLGSSCPLFLLPYSFVFSQFFFQAFSV